MNPHEGPAVLVPFRVEITEETLRAVEARDLGVLCARLDESYLAGGRVEHETHFPCDSQIWKGTGTHRLVNALLALAQGHDLTRLDRGGSDPVTEG